MGRLAILLALCAAAFGCGRAADGTATLASADGALSDPRPLVARIETMELDTTSTSAILSVTGIAAAQGYWEGALVPVETADPGVLAFAFRAIPPDAPARLSTERSREVTVGVALGPNDLAGVREISVSAAQNARSIRR